MSDAHTKSGKILRADDVQWRNWQREANKRTGGNLTAYLCLAADSMVASGPNLAPAREQGTISQIEPCGDIHNHLVCF